MTVDVNKYEVGCTNYIYTHTVIYGKSVARRQSGELKYIRCDENVGIMPAISDVCSCGYQHKIFNEIVHGVCISKFSIDLFFP